MKQKTQEIIAFMADFGVKLNEDQINSIEASSKDFINYHKAEIAVHQNKSGGILRQLYAAWNALPISPLAALIGDAIQNLQFYDGVDQTLKNVKITIELDGNQSIVENPSIELIEKESQKLILDARKPKTTNRPMPI